MIKFERAGVKVTDVYVSRLDDGKIKAVYGRLSWSDDNGKNELRVSFEDTDIPQLEFWASRDMALVFSAWVSFRVYTSRENGQSNNLITVHAPQFSIDQQALSDMVKLAKQMENGGAPKS